MIKNAIYLCILICLTGPAFAESSGTVNESPAITVMEAIKITGNQEQPRLLYLLPWQKAGDMKGLGTQSGYTVNRADIDFIEPRHFQRAVFLKQKLLGDERASASELKKQAP